MLTYSKIQDTYLGVFIPAVFFLVITIGGIINLFWADYNGIATLVLCLSVWAAVSLVRNLDRMSETLKAKL